MLPITEDQIQQVYTYLKNLLNYFKIPVTNVIQLDLVVSGEDNSFSDRAEILLFANEV